MRLENIEDKNTETFSETEYAFSTPKIHKIAKKTDIPPINGWERNTYYVVEVAFSKMNPIHRRIFYTGQLNKKKPCCLNSFAKFQCGSDVLDAEPNLTYADAYYIKAIALIEFY